MLTRKLVARAKKERERKKKEREEASVEFEDGGGFVGGRKGKRSREQDIVARCLRLRRECIPRGAIMPAEYQRERALPINRFAKFMVPMTARGRDAVPVRESSLPLALLPSAAPRRRVSRDIRLDSYVCAESARPREPSVWEAPDFGREETRCTKINYRATLC